MWLWDYFWKEWEGHTGNEVEGYDFSCLQSAPSVGVKLSELQGIKSGDGALDLEAGKC